MPDSECGFWVAVLVGYGRGVFGGEGSALAMVAVSPMTAIPNPAASTLLAALLFSLGRVVRWR
jgi:hypothetical protein